jgi:glutamine amidotransferase
VIAIIDYGSGNVRAIANIYKQMRVPHAIVSDPRELDAASRYILPGVGHFDMTMRTMKKAGIVSTLTDNVVGAKKPLLGICVGMQLLATHSEEGDTEGLGWIEGHVRELDARPERRLPHMGWNSVAIVNDPAALFGGVDADRGFYFLHRYHFVPTDAASTSAVTDYCERMVCGVSNGRNIFGLQFHPEKSHRNGVTIFKNFAELPLA